MRRQINSDELGHLYKQIGEAIWHLQHVENALVPFIIIKGIAKEPNSLEEAVALKHQKELNKLPLGILIKRVTKLNILEEPLLNRIRRFNDERKWIVHNSVFESGDQLYTDSGRNAVFTRINEFIEEARFIYKSLGKLLMDYTISKGMDEKEINEVAINHIRKLKGEE